MNFFRSIIIIVFHLNGAVKKKRLSTLIYSFLFSPFTFCKLFKPHYCPTKYVKRKNYEMGNNTSRLLDFQTRKVQCSCTVVKIKHPETNFISTLLAEISDAFANVLSNYEVQG